MRGGTSAAVQWGDLCRLVPSLEKTVPSQQRDDLTRVVNAKVNIKGSMQMQHKVPIITNASQY